MGKKLDFALVYRVENAWDSLSFMEEALLFNSVITNVQTSNFDAYN